MLPPSYALVALMFKIGMWEGLRQFFDDGAAILVILITLSFQSSLTDSRLGSKAVGGFRLVLRTKPSAFITLGLSLSDEAGFAGD